MKHTIFYPILLVLIVLSGCTAKHETTSSTSDADDWKEMDSFHMIMAEAFHPYKDSTNLAPAKKLAEELAVEADKWTSAPLPEKVNTEEVKAQLQKLKVDTRSFADLIKNNGDDVAIGTSLNALHSSFHGIMEAWHGGKEQHEHEKH
jgi:hypothetical protein